MTAAGRAGTLGFQRFEPFDLAQDRLRLSFDELRMSVKLTDHGERVEPSNGWNGWNSKPAIGYRPRKSGLFPNWEHAILNRASYFGEGAKVLLGKASGCRESAESMVYRGEESQLEWASGHQNCIPHGKHPSQQPCRLQHKGKYLSFSRSRQVRVSGGLYPLHRHPCRVRQNPSRRGLT